VAYKYSKFLYIYNAHPPFKVDLIKDLLSKVYLSQFTNKDYINIIKYLEKCFKSNYNQAITIIIRITSAGKSKFLSHIIIAFLIGDLNTHIIIIALSN
jgi:hypothetical protein